MNASIINGAAADPVGTTIAAGEFLAFKLDREEYGIPIQCVQEIRSFEAPTHLANAPDFILGVVNLRGIIVPVVDLRRKFRLLSAPFDANTVTIVLNIGARTIGVVVDAVSDVLALNAAQLRPVPDFNATLITDYLLAIATLDERMLIIIDIEKLLTGDEMSLEQALR